MIASVIPPIARIRASAERLTAITVCTRPFRGTGPRIEAERVGDKLVLHNYGHGGSGWSLSWGSAAVILPMAFAEQTRRIAVIGCGALGLTSALTLQRGGAHVTIYARELPPFVRSSKATGSWTPDSRVMLAAHASAAATQRWEGMARTSHAAFRASLDLPRRPVAKQDRYIPSDMPPDEAFAERVQEDPIGFARLEHRLADLFPPTVDLAPGDHPFPAAYCRRIATLRFDIPEYSRHLLDEFRGRGGEVRQAEFHTPADLSRLAETVIVHCTGYGARALFGDDSLIPVRGQIAWLPPQPEVDYSLIWGDLNVVARTDGIVVQLGAHRAEAGWADASEAPDAREAEEALQSLRAFYARMR